MSSEYSDQALLVIDVQHGLFNKSTKIFRERELLQNINDLVERAHSLSIPVVFVQHSNKGFLKEETDGWKLHPSLNPYKGDLFIRKKHGSAFQDTQLEAELKKLNTKKIVVVGLTSHGCVKATCIDGHKRGFQVILVQDAHSSYNKEAERLIFEWNEKLSKGTVILKSAQEMASLVWSRYIT